VLEDSFGDAYENLNKTLPKENVISWEQSQLLMLEK